MDFTVIVCVYNSPEYELKDTLDSIVIQRDVSFELIIADDCSKNSYEAFVKAYFESYPEINYRYIRNEQNLGTVKNLLHAVSYANGNYIKTIGAGDYLFDEDVLYHSQEYIDKSHAGIFFGELVGFVENNFVKYDTAYKNPISPECYKRADMKSIKENFLIYGDHVSGASLFYEKELFVKYLKYISGKIIYVEDYIPIFAAVDGIKIGYIDKKMVCYKLGTGISTTKNKKNYDRIQKDRLAFDDLIIDYAATDPVVKKYAKIVKVNRYPRLIKWIIKFFMIPKDIYFNLMKKRNFRCGLIVADK